jgi:tetratricopeptide (TPR) repeat protein
LVAALAITAVLAVPAWGAEGDKAAAMAHFEAANRLYDIHEYAKALEEYKAAYLAKPDAAFLFNVGQCYRKLGRRVQALEFYQEYLKKAPPDDPSRPYVEARIRDTDTGDIFEGNTSTRSATQPIQAPPPPLVQPTPLPAEVQPVAETEIETATQQPPSAVDSPVGQPSPAPSLPPSAESVTAKSAGLDLTAVQPAEPVSASTPFYKTWWFWTGVGAAVVAGTVTAILISKSSSDGNTTSAALGTQPVFQ